MPEPVEPNEESASISEEVMADLERAAEAASIDASSLQSNPSMEDHQRLYAMIDELAAPIRVALKAGESLPELPDYRDLVEIGRGGMGVVYSGFHNKTLRRDAIKVIRPDRLLTASSETARHLRLRFEQESQLAARIAHEHIVPVYQVGEVDRAPWYSMQLVDGVSLHELSRKGCMSPERAAGLVAQIARAIDTVHRHGILHGDIKPHNILIENETGRPLITDFGLADLLACHADAALSGVAGTPAYMAPELARAAVENRSPAEVAAIRSVASDVYSLGATLYVALTGRSPCDGGPVQQQLVDIENRRPRLFGKGNDCSHLPRPLQQICQKCLAEDPSDRFDSAGELAEALSAWLDRPRWNRHFPKLRRLLAFVLAPVLLASGFVVNGLLNGAFAETWVWLAVFFGYIPLFGAFLASDRQQAANPARRELWSVWTGHLVGSLSCWIALRILCHPDLGRALVLFYPSWAAISAGVFFAKSGNFWDAYRWFGCLWAGIAVLLALTPSLGPILFGCFAAATCLMIAWGDRAFLNDD